MDERFERLTVPEPNSGCLIWLGAVSGDGYGSIKIDGHARCAHVVNYEREKGPVPEGMELDHLCRVRLCVNPDHLEPVAHQLNVLRGSLPSVARERMMGNRLFEYRKRRL